MFHDEWLASNSNLKNPINNSYDLHFNINFNEMDKVPMSLDTPNTLISNKTKLLKLNDFFKQFTRQ